MLTPKFYYCSLSITTYTSPFPFFKYAKTILYLGQTGKANPVRDKEIERRIGMVKRAFGKEGDIMKSNLPLSLKRKVYN